MPRHGLVYLAGSVIVGLNLLALVQATEMEPTSHKQPKSVFKQVSGRRTKEVRQREGTKLVEIPGRFVLAGDRVSFVPNDSHEGSAYRVLENLALERVLDNINESRSDRLWIVSGVLTEFRSTNHLLITKAVLQSPTTETAP